MFFFKYENAKPFEIAGRVSISDTFKWVNILIG